MFSLLAVSMGGVIAAGVTASPQPLASLDVELQERRPTVNVVLQGVERSLFLDLGAHNGVGLREEIAESGAVEFSGKVQTWRNGEGQMFSSRLFTVPKLSVGEVSVDGIGGIEVDASRPFSQDGYLGAPFFSRFTVVLDYRSKKLHLFPADSIKKLRDLCPDPFALEVSGSLVQSRVQTDHGELIFQWDTGSNQNRLRPSAVHASAELKDFAFSSFRLGDTDFGRTRMPLVEFAAPSVDGILGADFFETKTVCLDLHAQLAALKR